MSNVNVPDPSKKASRAKVDKTASLPIAIPTNQDNTLKVEAPNVEQPKVVKPKKPRGSNAYMTHVKEFRQANPQYNHLDAMKKAKETYKKDKKDKN